MSLIKKSQVLLIIVFAIMITSIIVFVLLLPILSNLRSLRETTYTYQALASAEAGLELELYNQVLGTSTDFISSISGGIISNPNNHRRETYKEQFKIGKTLGFKMGEVSCNLYISTTTINGIEYLKIEAEGLKENYSRILFVLSPM